MGARYAETPIEAFAINGLDLGEMYGTSRNPQKSRQLDAKGHHTARQRSRCADIRDRLTNSGEDVR